VLLAQLTGVVLFPDFKCNYDVPTTQAPQITVVIRRKKNRFHHRDMHGDFNTIIRKIADDPLPAPHDLLSFWQFNVEGRIEVICIDLDHVHPNTLEHPPTYIVQSSPGKWHAYYIIKTSIVYNKNNFNQVRAFRIKCGGDPRHHNFSMRMPGSVNDKHGYFINKVIDFGPTYEAQELLHHVTDEVDSLTESSKCSVRHTRAEKKRLKAKLASYSEDLDQTPAKPKKIISCPVPEKDAPTSLVKKRKPRKLSRTLEDKKRHWMKKHQMLFKSKPRRYSTSSFLSSDFALLEGQRNDKLRQLALRFYQSMEPEELLAQCYAHPDTTTKTSERQSLLELKSMYRFLNRTNDPSKCSFSLDDVDLNAHKNLSLTEQRRKIFCFYHYAVTHGNGHIAQHQVASALGTHQRTVSRETQWLEQNGYLERLSVGVPGRASTYRVLKNVQGDRMLSSFFNVFYNRRQNFHRQEPQEYHEQPIEISEKPPDKPPDIRNNVNQKIIDKETIKLNEQLRELVDLSYLN